MAGEELRWGAVRGLRVALPSREAGAEDGGLQEARRLAGPDDGILPHYLHGALDQVGTVLLDQRAHVPVLASLAGEDDGGWAQFIPRTLRRRDEPTGRADPPPIRDRSRRGALRAPRTARRRRRRGPPRARARAPTGG